MLTIQRSAEKQHSLAPAPETDHTFCNGSETAAVDRDHEDLFLPSGGNSRNDHIPAIWGPYGMAHPIVVEEGQELIDETIRGLERGQQRRLS